jgi:hypothetical protein
MTLDREEAHAPAIDRAGDEALKAIGRIDTNPALAGDVEVAASPALLTRLDVVGVREIALAGAAAQERDGRHLSVPWFERPSSDAGAFRQHRSHHCGAIDQHRARPRIIAVEIDSHQRRHKVRRLSSPGPRKDAMTIDPTSERSPEWGIIVTWHGDKAQKTAPPNDDPALIECGHRWFPSEPYARAWVESLPRTRFRRLVNVKVAWVGPIRACPICPVCKTALGATDWRA